MTLIIVEQNATLAEFFFEYVILSSQILNDLLSVSIDPAGHDENE
ncbi:MAG: hypothetical protein VST67_03560 [Nitrospirota bacterium]|nr:hypothetical protein [Nitrospirota bacterium]